MYMYQVYCSVVMCVCVSHNIILYSELHVCVLAYKLLQSTIEQANKITCLYIDDIITYKQDHTYINITYTFNLCKSFHVLFIVYAQEHNVAAVNKL